MTPDKVCMIIVACAVLHNMAIMWKQPLLSEEPYNVTYPSELFEVEDAGHMAAKHYRDQFSIHNFS